VPWRIDARHLKLRFMDPVLVDNQK